jgi:hypothetical protein
MASLLRVYQPEFVPTEEPTATKVNVYVPLAGRYSVKIWTDAEFRAISDKRPYRAAIRSGPYWVLLEAI